MPEHLDRLTDSLARDTSRRGFLARVGGALVALTAARTVGTLIEPGESEAFHFCGHTFTTGSCPHPTGLPRIDSRGFPLRASDGQPIDDIGRPVNGEGQPIDDDGKLLRDAEGRPLPPAPRTQLCARAHRCCLTPFKLDLKDRFFMLFINYHLYITYTLTGFLFDLDQAVLCRDIQKIELN